MVPENIPSLLSILRSLAISQLTYNAENSTDCSFVELYHLRYKT